MRKIFYIFVLLFAFFTESCAQRHADVRTPSLANAENKAQSVVVDPASLVDVSKLKAPQVTLNAQDVCTKNSTSDKALQITVANDAPFDVFEVKACDDAVQNCSQTQSFLDTHYLFNPPSSDTVYTKVLFRSCVDAFHSVTHEKSCTDWQTKNFSFQSLSPQATKLLARQQEIRSRMEGICKELRDEMTTFVNSPQTPSGSTKNLPDLKSMVQNTLNNVSESTCVEMLVSNELAILDNVAVLVNQLSSGQDSTSGTGGNGKTKTIIHDPATGFMFLVAGGSGLVLSAWGLVGTIRNTKSPGYVKLLGKIVQLKKVIQHFEVQNLNQQIEFLEKLVNELEAKAKVESGDIYEGVKGQLKEVDKNIDKAFEEFERKYLPDNSEEIAERKEKLGKLKADVKANPSMSKQDFLGRILEIIPPTPQPSQSGKEEEVSSRVQPEVDQRWWWQRLAPEVLGGLPNPSNPHDQVRVNLENMERGVMGRFFDNAIALIMERSEGYPEVKILLEMQKKEDVHKVGAMFGEYNFFVGEFYKPNPKQDEKGKAQNSPAEIAATGVDEIRAHIEELKKQKVYLEGTWSDYGLKILGGAAGGATEGALKGMFMGLGIGGLYEGTVGRITGGGPGLGTAAAVGGGLGGIAGGIKGAYEMFQDQRPPELNAEQRELYNKKDLFEEGVSKRTEYINKSQQDLKKFQKKLWLRKDVFSLSALSLKARASIPWLVAIGVSGATTAVGAQQMSLADVLSPQDQFLQDFSATYSQAGSLQREYTTNLIQLYGGSCGK